MTRTLFLLLLALPLAACAGGMPRDNFVPSKKSAVELRAMQSRLIAASSDAAIRAVVATLHDLGYRITKVEPGAGTVSATRQTALRLAVVVQPRGNEQSIVRANATIVTAALESQVDSPEFYLTNFFAPLGATLHREPLAVPQEVSAPEPVRPTPELTVQQQRAAAARQAAPAPLPTGVPSR